MKFALLFACAIVALLIASCTTNKGSFFLVNRAQEPIIHASVVVCGQRIELNNVAPNGTAGGSYKVNSDSHYTVQVEFLSGKKLNGDVGYVTNGMDFKHEIVVSDTEIKIKIASSIQNRRAEN